MLNDRDLENVLFGFCHVVWKIVSTSLVKLKESNPNNSQKLARLPPLGACARPPADGSLRSPIHFTARYVRPPQRKKKKKKIPNKNFKRRKNFEKIFEKKNRQKFFFEFSIFFSVEIFHMMSTLRMQSFMIIGLGVPEIRGGTDRRTNYFRYIDVSRKQNNKSMR